MLCIRFLDISYLLFVWIFSIKFESIKASFYIPNFHISYDILHTHTNIFHMYNIPMTWMQTINNFKTYSFISCAG